MSVGHLSNTMISKHGVTEPRNLSDSFLTLLFFKKSIHKKRLRFEIFILGFVKSSKAHLSQNLIGGSFSPAVISERTYIVLDKQFARVTSKHISVANVLILSWFSRSVLTAEGNIGTSNLKLNLLSLSCKLSENFEPTYLLFTTFSVHTSIFFFSPKFELTLRENRKCFHTWGCKTFMRFLTRPFFQKELMPSNIITNVGHEKRRKVNTGYYH